MAEYRVEKTETGVDLTLNVGKYHVVSFTMEYIEPSALVDFEGEIEITMGDTRWDQWWDSTITIPVDALNEFIELLQQTLKDTDQ